MEPFHATIFFTANLCLLFKNEKFLWEKVKNYFTDLRGDFPLASPPRPPPPLLNLYIPSEKFSLLREGHNYLFLDKKRVVLGKKRHYFWPISRHV